jgi:hypothetical protein
MSTRGAGRAPRRARQTSFAALATLAALSLGACGESDFTNEPPRAAASIAVAAVVDQREVVVSPDHFGAGLVNFTITNFSNAPVRFTLSGPKDTASQQIPPGAPAGSSESPTSPVTPTTASLKVELPEGSYEATAGQGSSAKPDTVEVGPERTSSKDKLLEP